MGRRKLSHRLGPFLARALGPPLVRLLGATWRVRYDPPDMRERARTGSAVYAFWHGRLLMPTALFTDYGMTVMISRHADGEIIARIAERLGSRTVRGSTTRGGAAALLAMVEVLRAGGGGIFTPDGPRGPREVAQSGAVFAASRAGVPLIPVGAAARGAWELRSWDRFRIPRPFTRVAMVLGEPLHPPPGLEGDDLEAFRVRFEEGMRAANGRAERLAAGEEA
ncbi:MAG: lysophospholipid acyltransferase family protein [Planctomycetes bacterium]|nr:lysophospholipid acyltransferase family protein [Planctomycetota bacterium]